MAFYALNKLLLLLNSVCHHYNTFILRLFYTTIAKCCDRLSLLYMFIFPTFSFSLEFRLLDILNSSTPHAHHAHILVSPTCLSPP